MRTLKTLIFALLSFSFSVNAASPDCEALYKKRASMDPILFLVDHASELVAKKCQTQPQASQIRATLTGEDLRRSSSLLMSNCTKKTDPRLCMKKVNAQVDDIKLLNGGSFGQNEAEKNRQTLREDRMEVLRDVKDSIREGDRSEIIYCCTFGSHIIYSDDKNHPLCESPASACPGIRKLAPLTPRSRTGIAR